MSRKISIIGRIFENFRNSLGAPGQKVHLIGVDHLKNKYFEKESDKSRNLKGSRWVETEDGDQWKVPELPTEWESWLRGRRKNPPSEQEIARNHALMMRTKHRAKELQEKEMLEEAKAIPSEQPYTSTVDPNESKNKSKFPVYSDFEIQPGDSRKDKK